MSVRRQHLIDCRPRWVVRGPTGSDGVTGPVRGLRFDCPEGHADCHHIIPFTPALDGQHVPTWQANGAQWQRFGETFDTLTLQPSIRRVPVPGHLDCALHINITDGKIVFHGDSH